MTHATIDDCMAEFDPTCPTCLEHDETCGLRCSQCDDRMCMFYGPEPVAIACGAHDDLCADCGADNPCGWCAMERRSA